MSIRGDAPLRATMFHAVGLKAIAATEMRSDCFEKSTIDEKSWRLAMTETEPREDDEDGECRGREHT